MLFPPFTSLQWVCKHFIIKNRNIINLRHISSGYSCSLIKFGSPWLSFKIFYNLTQFTYVLLYPKQRSLCLSQRCTDLQVPKAYFCPVFSLHSVQFTQILLYPNPTCLSRPRPAKTLWDSPSWSLYFWVSLCLLHH